MKNRIDILRQRLGDSKAALISGRANIFYYSGFTSEDAMLLITPDKSIIFTDSRYTIQAQQQAKDYEFLNSEKGLQELFSGSCPDEIIIEDKCVTLSQISKIRESAPDKRFLGGSNLITLSRAVKDASEIKKIAEAERLGDEAFAYILKFIKAGMSEREIAIELEFFMRKNGASGLSFETISASGVRSAMPHGTASDKILCDGDLFTLDFGCVLDGYCSDMTRTVGIGHLDEKSKEIYNIVLKAQKNALNTLRAGLNCVDADKSARDVIKSAGYGGFFRHSLGHSVGIEIHEKPNLSPKSKDILEVGNVVTVEPGIYIEDFGGVRIEDVVAIAENGINNLTSSAKELIIL